MSLLGALSGIGAVASLFGGKKSNPYTAQMNEANQKVGLTGRNYLNNYNVQQGRYDTYQPQAELAVSNYAKYLQSNPWTDQESNAYVTNATRGVNNAYNAAQANLTRNMEQRGLTGSSAEIGGLASIENARAATIAGAQNDLARQQMTDRNARQAALVGLFTGQANDAQGDAMNALGAANGVYSNQLGMYSNLAQQRDIQNAAANANTWGNLGSALGTLAPGADSTLARFFARKSTPGITGIDWSATMPRG